MIRGPLYPTTFLLQKWKCAESLLLSAREGAAIGLATSRTEPEGSIGPAGFSGSGVWTAGERNAGEFLAGTSGPLG
jgi:hypothetical protein